MLGFVRVHILHHANNGPVYGKVRKYYRITPLGRRALQVARDKALELIDEITEVEILVGGSRIGVAPRR